MMARHKRDMKPVNDSCNYHPLFIQGKVLSNAIPMTSRKRDIGERVSPVSIAWVKTKRVILLRVFPDVWVTMKSWFGNSNTSALWKHNPIQFSIL
jgi:hypothetical protein